MNLQRRRFLVLLSATGMVLGGCRATRPRSSEFVAADIGEPENNPFDFSNPLAGLEDQAIRDQIPVEDDGGTANAQISQLDGREQQLLVEVVEHLERVQRLVGHGNFALLGFDQMLGYARNYSQVGEFTSRELAFMERIFHVDAREYGFMGEKVLGRLTETIKEKETFKVPYTGNYLYRHESLNLYERVKKDVGDELVLTSGIRGIVKQLYLFLAKAVKTQGNLSLASHSLAPPGYSYHGIGDFDVGQRQLGYANFTEQFADTEVFDKLVQLGYVDIRYTDGNTLGVRYEPWHVKVI